MKRVLFLFSLILMLGVSTNSVIAGEKVEASEYPCVGIIYQNVHEDMNYDCSAWKLLPLNNPFVSYEMSFDGYILKIKASRTLVEEMTGYNNGEYFDLPVKVERGGGIIYAVVRIKFVY